MSFSFQIKCVNIRGLGIHKNSKFRTHKVPSKIKELVCSSSHLPTFYALTETKLRHDHRKIKLPFGLNYVGETSGCGRFSRNDDTRRGGIFLFKDKSILVNDRKSDIRVISSEHAMYCRLLVSKDVFV